MAKCLYSGDKPLGIVQSNAEDVEYSSGVSVKDKIDSLITYSSTEKVVGEWIDGKPIYQKTVNFGALPDNTTKAVSHGISNISKVVSIEGWATNGSDFFSLSYYNPLASNYSAGVYATYSDVIIKTGGNLTPYTTCYVTLKYTKTTD